MTDGLKIQNDTMTAIAAVRERQYAKCRRQREQLLEALEMVRDADENCKLDGLPTIPPFARAKIDAAIAFGSDRKAALQDDGGGR